MKQKRTYETPTTTVVKLQHQAQLLQSSLNATMNATMEETWIEETI